MGSDYNLLQDRLIGVILSNGTVINCSLPEIFEHLSNRDVLGFSALQHFQRHSFYAFLVQLAAIALNRVGYNISNRSASQWVELLLNMTFDEMEPWCLVVEDLSKPAFMQPPVVEGSLKTFRRISTSDGMDVLVTSKNHDVKAERVYFAQPQHWIFSLISCQTMEGYLGADNYGIARMNGGHASRPCVTYVPSIINIGERFYRDVEILLADRDLLADAYGYEKDNGYELLWLEEWNGTDQIQLKDCDPFFIEICRRFRLTADRDGTINGSKKSTKKRRIDAKEIKGKTGDPWTPIDTKEKKAINIGAAGFSYQRVHSLMLEERYVPGITQQICDDDQEMLQFFACAMARGKGKTDGYHERWIPIPGNIQEMLRYDDTTQQLCQRSAVRIDVVSTVRKSILKPALCALLQAGREKLDFSDVRPLRWLAGLDEAVDAIYFERLWEDIAFENRDEVEVLWQKTVIDLGREQLLDAIATAPYSTMRRYKAIAAAERFYNGGAYNQFPDVFKKKEEETEDTATIGERKAEEANSQFEKQEEVLDV